MALSDAEKQRARHARLKAAGYRMLQHKIKADHYETIKYWLDNVINEPGVRLVGLVIRDAKGHLITNAAK